MSETGKSLWPNSIWPTQKEVDESSQPTRPLTYGEWFERSKNIISSLFTMQRDLDEGKKKVEDACAKFVANVISRYKGGSTYIDWDFNDRGTLIEIIYETPDRFDSPVTCKEAVSFEELVPYMEKPEFLSKGL